LPNPCLSKKHVLFQAFEEVDLVQGGPGFLEQREFSLVDHMIGRPFLHFREAGNAVVVGVAVDQRIGGDIPFAEAALIFFFRLNNVLHRSQRKNLEVDFALGVGGGVRWG
jgi:hypothetical protein